MTPPDDSKGAAENSSSAKRELSMLLEHEGSGTGGGCVSGAGRRASDMGQHGAPSASPAMVLVGLASDRDGHHEAFASKSGMRAARDQCTRACKQPTWSLQGGMTVRCFRSEELAALPMLGHTTASQHLTPTFFGDVQRGGRSRRHMVAKLVLDCLKAIRYAIKGHVPDS
eukprot:126248-Chlamydomonas_euryale.AAC.4